MKNSLGFCSWLSAATALLGCSSPELEGTNFSCSTTADCSSSEVCAPLNDVMACQPVEDSPIRIGMIGPLQGPSEDLGKEMSRGMEAFLEPFNRAGGVFGRRVELEKRNDNYDPDTAREMVRELLDVQEVVDDMNREDVRGSEGVFALVGNVGTPTMLATAPVATKNKVVFFGPFTGAQAYLRDDTNSPYVYNYRAGYANETAAMMEYISGLRIPRIVNNPAADYQRILVFAQKDSYGDAGYDGVRNAYNDQVAPLPDENAIRRVGYLREDVNSVDPAVVEAGEFLTNLLERSADQSARESVAIIMIDTYLPGNRFIRKLKDLIGADPVLTARLDVLFMNVSFVGSDSLAEALVTTPEVYTDSMGVTHRYADDVMVTQVVPYYGSQAAGVARYREDIESLDDGKFTYTSLEGYVVARLFTEALKLNGPTLTTDSFVQTLDHKIKQLDIGIGTELTFSPTEHQACYTVWGSQIGADGTFSEVPFIWNRDNGIETN